MPRKLNELRAADWHWYREIDDLPRDLRSYYEPDVAGGIDRFCHPLHVGLIPMPLPKPIEKVIASKQAMLDERLEQRRFESALSLIEPPWRTDSLRNWERSGLLGEGRKADVRYWKLVGFAWTDTEWPSTNPDWRPCCPARGVTPKP